MTIVNPRIPSIAGQPGAHNSYFTTQYWTGAVQIDAGHNLSGSGAISGNYTKGVYSFWANYDNTASFTPVPGNTNSAGGHFLKQTSSNGVVVWIGPPNGLFQIYIIDLNTGTSIGAANIISTDTPFLTKYNGNKTWNHYICSFDVAQLNYDTDFGQLNSAFTNIYPNNVVRFQMGINGSIQDSLPVGQGGNTGYTIMDRDINPPGGDFNYSVSTLNISGAGNNEFQIGADSSSPCQYAYCYFGISNSFFDLNAISPATGLRNVNYFITDQGNPVNLGRYGSNVPLECVYMHTGSVGRFFTGPAVFPWNPNAFYIAADVVVYQGNYYQALLPIAPGDATPDVNSNWLLLPSITTGATQFAYNAANGRPWGGPISTVPVQPPGGI